MFQKEKKYLRNSKTTFSSHQLHRDSREHCAMNRKCQFDRLSTKINFINRRLWAIDETKHRWKCLWCFDSSFQTFSLRHHDRFSLFRQEKKARRRLKSYLFEERARFEFFRKKKKKRKKMKMKSEKKKRRKKKKKKKKEKKEKKRKEKWCFRRANRCKQTASDANSRFRQKDVFSFCHEEVDNSRNKLKNWKSFSCFFDVSLKSMIKNLVKKNLKRVHRRFLDSSSTSINTFIVLCWRFEKFLYRFFDIVHVFFFHSFVVWMRIFESFN
jgi:flagellar biosynthesis GTPase FlhF